MTPPDSSPSRAVAVLVSLFVGPGVGHAYIGRIRRGLGFALVPVLGAIALAAAFPALVRSGAATIGIVPLVAILLANVIAAIDVATIPPASYARMSGGRSVAVIFGAWGLMIVLAVATSLTIRFTVLEAFKIPAASMAPTLLNGDHVFVDKKGARGQAPGRGDVIVFEFPERPTHDFVKRAIALPGDRLEVRNGHPSLNGWEVPYCSLGMTKMPTDPRDDLPQAAQDAELFVEFLGASAYLVLLEKSELSFMTEYQGPYVVKPGETWVLGDNRNNSHDSRMWFAGQGGGVPYTSIKGRAFVRWLARTPDGSLDNARMGGIDAPTLPPAMSALAPALAKCLAERPSLEKTTPPPPALAAR